MTAVLFEPLQSLIVTSDTFRAKVGAATEAEAKIYVLHYDMDDEGEEFVGTQTPFRAGVLFVYVDLVADMEVSTKTPSIAKGTISFYVEEAFSVSRTLGECLKEHQEWMMDFLHEMMLNSRCNVPGAELIVKRIIVADRPRSVYPEDQATKGRIIKTKVTVFYGVS